MRDFKGMKRQRGRNRNKAGANNANNANPNRSWDSQGPENIKVRGNAQTVYERYQQLARDAASSGDRVLAENYQQHAEHYYRVLRALQPQRSFSDIAAREQSNQGFDIDFEDESGQAQGEAAETEGQDAESEERGGRERDRDENRRDDNRRDENRRDREDGGRREGRRDRWRDRDDRRDRSERGERGERPDRGERGDRPERDPMPVVEPQATPLVAESVSDAPVLRDAEGGSSEAPAFLQARAEPRAEGDEAPARRPRRRRAPRSFEGGEGAAASETEDA